MPGKRKRDDEAGEGEGGAPDASALLDPDAALPDEALRLVREQFKAARKKARGPVDMSNLEALAGEGEESEEEDEGGLLDWRFKK